MMFRSGPSSSTSVRELKESIISRETKIALTSSDGFVFDGEEAVVLECPAFADFINENRVSKSSSLIKIHDVNSATLAKVIDYCRRQAKARAADDVKAPDDFDAELLNLDPTTLFHLIHASHKLKIKSLRDLARKTFSDMFGKRIKKRIEGSSSAEGADNRNTGIREIVTMNAR